MAAIGLRPDRRHQPLDKRLRSYIADRGLLWPPAQDAWLPAEHEARFVAEIGDEYAVVVAGHRVILAADLKEGGSDMANPPCADRTSPAATAWADPDRQHRRATGGPPTAHLSALQIGRAMCCSRLSERGPGTGSFLAAPSRFVPDQLQNPCPVRDVSRSSAGPTPQRAGEHPAGGGFGIGRATTYENSTVTPVWLVWQPPQLDRSRFGGHRD